jgi:hypothetical protein
MFTTDTLNSILQSLITLVIIPAVIALGKAAFDYIRTKTHNAQLDKYLDMANDAIVTAVAETMQTFVTTLKNSGQWDEEAAKKAFDMAKQKAVEIMGAAALRALPEIVGDFEAWLTSKIETATLAAKCSMSAARAMLTGAQAAAI